MRGRRRRWRRFVGNIYFRWSGYDAGASSWPSNWSSCIRRLSADDRGYATSDGRDIARLRGYLFRHQFGTANVGDQFFSDVNVLFHFLRLGLFLLFWRLLLRHWNRRHQSSQLQILTIQVGYGEPNAANYKGNSEHSIDCNCTQDERAFAPQVLLVRTRLNKVIEHIILPIPVPNGSGVQNNLRREQSLL